MPLPQPPKRDSTRFDDWMFLLWKSLETLSAAASSSGFGAANTAAAAVTLADGYSLYVPELYEIGASGSLTIGTDSYFEIG